MLLLPLLLSVTPTGTPVANTGAPSPAVQSIFILDFTAALGADPELAKVAGTLTVSGFNEMGTYKVSTAADVNALIGVEEQRQLVGCATESCIAEIAGALGTDLLVTGSLSTLGESSVLTVKLIEASAGNLLNQLSESLPLRRDDLPEAMRAIAYKLVRQPVPPRATRPWYKNPWFWGGAVLGGVALGAGGYMLFGPSRVGDGALGTAVMDN